MKHISFVVPVFNEEANLREFYQRLTDIMSALPYEYDLTFVDDGSKDNTAEIAQKYQKRFQSRFDLSIKKMVDGVPLLIQVLEML